MQSLIRGFQFLFNISYTYKDQADVHLFYGRVWDNAKKIVRRSFPKQKNTLRKIFFSLSERGEFYSDKETSVPDRYVRIPEIEQAILYAVNANQQISMIHSSK